ncbi:PhzF family phenazine biosynthesis protein [Granulicoccus sp. GXG6511]|uniref:PhzF family phenazine biosynthesis protein n=1 Tax=Granulicoccus sp. GXG6511 TaxID=3381351 RepID=UPI003D7DC30A
MTHDFDQVDVFSAEPFGGNPLAVVHAADDLDDPTMAAFARWTNLSETTFLLTPTDAAADYRVRIFTTGGELPFAGHPTLGSCRAWLERGGVPRGAEVVQQCAAGLIRIRRVGDLLAFEAPPLVRSGPVDAAEASAVLAGLRLGGAVDMAWIDNGPGWIGVRLESAEQVLAVQPDPVRLRHNVALIGPWGGRGPAEVEVRCFVSEAGIVEDPVTGSANAGLAMWLTASGALPARYVAAQGTVIGRAGRVFVERVGDTIWVGGHARSLIRGMWG